MTEETVKKRGISKKIFFGVIFFFFVFILVHIFLILWTDRTKKSGTFAVTVEPIGTQKIVDKNGVLQMQEDLINYLPDDSLISHPVTFDADTKNFLYYNHVSQDKKPAELFVSNNPYWLKFGLALQRNLSVGPDIIKVSHDLKTMTIALHTKDHHVAFVTNGVPPFFRTLLILISFFAIMTIRMLFLEKKITLIWLRLLLEEFK